MPNAERGVTDARPVSHWSETGLGFLCDRVVPQHYVGFGTSSSRIDSMSLSLKSSRLLRELEEY